MALAAVACGHMQFVSVRPAGFASSGTANSLSTSRKLSWNPLALKSRSQFLGTKLYVQSPRLSVASHRNVFKCVKASGDTAAEEGRDGVDKKQGENMWSRLAKQGTELVSEGVKRFSKPTMAVMLSLLLTQVNPDMAFAAGGGRVGGRVGGGGGGGGASRSYSAPSRSYSAPSRPYSGPLGGYSMPRPYIAPSPGFSYAVPYAAPSPFFGGGALYAAPAFGFGGGSVFFLVIMGFILLQAIYGFVSERSGLGGSTLMNGTQKASVLKLQVGLLGMARTLQQDLDRMSEQADTTTAEGLHHVLTETCLALMRHPDYCTSALASTDVNRSMSVSEERFNNFSLEERGKFDEETLINVNNLRKRIMGATNPQRFNNEYIVVTILVMAEGEYKLPAINNNTNLKAALRTLGSIPTDSIQAVEVLWTPQDENDTLSERELLRDYPLLHPL